MAEFRVKSDAGVEGDVYISAPEGTATFKDGQTVTIDDSAPQLVALLSQHPLLERVDDPPAPEPESADAVDADEAQKQADSAPDFVETSDPPQGDVSGAPWDNVD